MIYWIKLRETENKMVNMVKEKGVRVVNKGVKIEEKEDVFLKESQEEVKERDKEEISKIKANLI